MRVLLDTNVISEIRRAGAHPGVVQRVRELNPQDTYISVISMGEVSYGIKRLAGGRKRRELEAWLATLEVGFASQILTIDLETAQSWGEMAAAAEANGKALSPQDGLIAATALRHGLHLMTRNTRDFEGIGILLINPWEP